MDDANLSRARFAIADRWRFWCETVLIAAAVLVAAISARDYAGGWNDGSRLATVESLVDRHTLAIDESVFVRSSDTAGAPNPYVPGDELLRTNGTQDKLLIGGHYYSDKSPLPAFWLAGWYQFLQAVSAITAREHPRLFCYLMTVMSSGMAYVITVWSVWRLSLRKGLPPATCLLLSASVALATVTLPYVRHVNNHILLLSVVALLMLILDRLAIEREKEAGRGREGMNLSLSLGEGRGKGPWKRGEASLEQGRTNERAARPHPNPLPKEEGTSSLSLRLFPKDSFLPASLAGGLAGLGYTFDLGLGPVLLVSAALIVAYRTRSAGAIVCFGSAALPWLIAHHAVNYRIGGTFGPANSVAEYLGWPGSPFSPKNMTGGWAHRDFGHFALYAAALLFGKHGFLNYNLPMFAALAAPAFVFLRRLVELPEILFGAAFSTAAWLLYAALSNNYSGPCCSIRWFVPLLAPGYYALIILLRERPDLVRPFAFLNVCGLALSTWLWWNGPWEGTVPVLLWPLNAAALLLVLFGRKDSSSPSVAPDESLRRQAA